jgi:hypothetical protein
MTENIGDLVAEHPLFSGLPTDVAELVGGCSQNVAIATGQLLLEEGEPARSLYLLRRGHVALEVHEPGRVPLVIDRDGADRLESAGIEVPPVRGEHPGPADGLSWAYPVDDKRHATRLVHLERHVATTEQVKRPRWFAFLQQELARGDRHVLRTACDQLGHVSW